MLPVARIDTRLATCPDVKIPVKALPASTSRPQRQAFPGHGSSRCFDFGATLRTDKSTRTTVPHPGSRSLVGGSSLRRSLVSGEMGGDSYWALSKRGSPESLPCPPPGRRGRKRRRFLHRAHDPKINPTQEKRIAYIIPSTSSRITPTARKRTPSRRSPPPPRPPVSQDSLREDREAQGGREARDIIPEP